MKCSIYRGKRREDHYVYLPEAENFNAIPDAVKRIFGEFVLAMEIELTPETKLANINPSDILEKIAEQGFYLQVPPKIEMLDVKVGDYVRERPERTE